MRLSNVAAKGFPASAGVFLGLGLGGFFDGIVLHQILQWHHMLTSAGYPADSVQNLKVDTFWDGLFHASTYLFVVVGLAILWRAARRPHLAWSGRMLAGSILIGFGMFNVVEGVVDRHILRIHHVNETVQVEQWIYWDIGFLLWAPPCSLAADCYSTPASARLPHFHRPDRGLHARGKSAPICRQL